jgi:hypothetical protein
LADRTWNVMESSPNLKLQNLGITKSSATMPKIKDLQYTLNFKGRNPLQLEIQVQDIINQSNHWTQAADMSYRKSTTVLAIK